MKVSKLISELEKLPQDMSVICSISSEYYVASDGPIAEIEISYNKFFRKNIVALVCHYNKPFSYAVSSVVHVLGSGLNVLGKVIRRSRRHFRGLNYYLIEYPTPERKKHRAWFVEQELMQNNLQPDAEGRLKKAIREFQEKNKLIGSLSASI